MIPHHTTQQPSSRESFRRSKARVGHSLGAKAAELQRVALGAGAAAVERVPESTSVLDLDLNSGVWSSFRSWFLACAGNLALAGVAVLPSQSRNW